MCLVKLDDSQKLNTTSTCGSVVYYLTYGGMWIKQNCFEADALILRVK